MARGAPLREIRGIIGRSIVVRVALAEFVGCGVADPLLQSRRRAGGIGVISVEGLQQSRRVLEVARRIPVVIGIETLPRYLGLQPLCLGKQPRYPDLLHLPLGLPVDLLRRFGVCRLLGKRVLRRLSQAVRVEEILAFERSAHVEYAAVTSFFNDAPGTGVLRVEARSWCRRGESFLADVDRVADREVSVPMRVCVRVG